MNKWVIDRFEEDFVVLENIKSLEVIELPRGSLPEDVREGMALIQDKGQFLLDLSEEAAARSHRIREKFNRLKRKK